MSLLSLANQKILITGALGAIGRTVVQVLAAHGATVLANDILPDQEARAAMALAEFPEDRVFYVPADIRDETAVERLFDCCRDLVGLPDVVCCHAGLVHAAPIACFAERDFVDTLDLNLRAHFLVAQTAVRHWQREQVPGHLIFTSSWVQDVPWPEITAYAASKSALRTMMRGFARELAAYDIRANAVAPGIVGVGMAKRQWNTDPAYRARARKAIPLGELQTAESVAHAFLFLCSALSSYMTGSVLLVDGGCSLYPMD